MNYLLNNLDTVWVHTVEHVQITAIAVGLAILIGVPLGILITRVPRLEPYVLGAASIFYLIPSLALFAVLIPITGLGSQPAIIGIILYAQLVLIRNTAVGINNTDTALIEAGKGMGMTRRQILWQLQIPLALPAIMAGIRVATVMSIGVASIAAYLGVGGLGVLIFRGMQSLHTEMVVAGALPVSLMAIVVERIIVLLELRLQRDRTYVSAASEGGERSTAAA